MLLFSAHARGLNKVFISSVVDVVSDIIANAKTDLSKRDIIGNPHAVGYTAKGAIRTKRKPCSQTQISPS